jgi:hypothetical protein
MFTCFSQRKNLWFKKGLWVALTFVMAALVFTGCPQPTDSEPSILPLPNGWYKSAALPPYDDGYGIANDVLTHYNDGNRDPDFAGQVEAYDNNVAIIKITTGNDWGPAVGKYYGVYIGDVTGFSFTGSSAYKADGHNSGMDTLAEAAAEYTDANGYFGYKAGYGRYAETAVITGTDSGLELSWAAVPGATGYDVYYTDGSTPPTSTTNPITTDVTITGTTAAITGLAGLPYNVWVRAKAGSNTGAWVYQGSGTPDLVIPANLTGYFQSLPWSADYAFYDDGFVVDASVKTFYYYTTATVRLTKNGAAPSSRSFPMAGPLS